MLSSSPPVGSVLEAANPPDLQPQLPLSNTPEDLPLDRASELLLKILAKLTVYQSIPDSSSLVLCVRDDVPMADACCLLLPSDKPRGSSNVTFASLEVLRRENWVYVPPDNFSKTLMEIALAIRDHDPLLSAALEVQARDLDDDDDECTFPPPSAYLTIADVFFFASIDSVGKNISVAEWLDWRMAQALERHGNPSVVRFCREMSLVNRASMSLCPGIRSGGLCSGSSMNLSLQSLLKASSSGGSNLSDNISTTSNSPCAVTTIGTSGLSGGSTLAAVTALLDRPWQVALPLTVTSEKDVSSIFGYVNLNQLMASVAMNCSDRMLEPFFAMEVGLGGNFGFVCEKNLSNVPVLHKHDASVFDAVEVLRASPIALLLSHTDETFNGFVTQDDLARILGNRMDVLAEYSDGSNEPMLDLHSTRLKDELGKLEAPNSTAVAVMRRETDFPCSFAVLLQKILLHSSGFAVVLNKDNRPTALITVRDVWTHAMTTKAGE